MPKKNFPVVLSTDDRQTLQQFIKTGVHAARSITRARILLLADADWSDPDIADEVGVCLATVFNLRRRYCQMGGCLAGIMTVLTDRPHTGAPRTFTGRQEAQITAVACTTPPEGRQRWTMELLADQVVRLQIVESISDTTIHRLLKKTTSNRGRNGNGVWGGSPASF